MIKIISCFWNVENYIERCIKSVLNQKNKNFKMILVDDLSTDKSVDIINKVIKDDDRFELVVNSQKKFKLKNMDDLIMDETFFNDDDIVIELDGDDYLYGDKVIDIIYDKYEKNKNLWITNGSFVYSNGTFGFSSKVNPNTIRTDNFTFSHLRTWKAHLWRNIDEADFLDYNGEYFKSAADVVYSFPMIEMAGIERYEFIPDIMYVYNAENPHNDHKDLSASGSKNEQLRIASLIRNMKKYKKL